MSIAFRFWSKVATAGPDDCWEWTGATTSAGYGVFRSGGRQRGAHRVAWFLERGAWPVGFLRHTCQSKRCVNPRHLTLGEPEMDLRAAASRVVLKTLCKHGHPLVTRPSVLEIVWSSSMLKLVEGV